MCKRTIVPMNDPPNIAAQHLFIPQNVPIAPISCILLIPFANYTNSKQYPTANQHAEHTSFVLCICGKTIDEKIPSRLSIIGCLSCISSVSKSMNVATSKNDVRMVQIANLSIVRPATHSIRNMSSFIASIRKNFVGIGQPQQNASPRRISHDMISMLQ